MDSTHGQEKIEQKYCPIALLKKRGCILVTQVSAGLRFQKAYLLHMTGYADPNTEKEYLAFERRRAYRFGTNQQVKSAFDSSLGEFDLLYKKLAE